MDRHRPSRFPCWAQGVVPAQRGEQLVGCPRGQALVAEDDGRSRKPRSRRSPVPLSGQDNPRCRCRRTFAEQSGLCHRARSAMDSTTWPRRPCTPWRRRMDGSDASLAAAPTLSCISHPFPLEGRECLLLMDATWPGPEPMIKQPTPPAYTRSRFNRQTSCTRWDSTTCVTNKRDGTLTPA